MPYRKLSLTILALLPASALPAQLSGKYTINPSGTGASNYRSFAAASFDLFTKGVNGAVVFDVAAGVYTEQWVLYPTLGASKTNTITFRSPKKSQARFTYSSRTGIGVYGLGSEVSEWYVFDGFGFQGSSGSSSYPRAFSIRGNHCTVRNCAFDKVTCDFYGDGHDVHHCYFGGSRTPVLLSGRGNEFHHNEVRLSLTRGRFMSVGSAAGRVRTRIYNNLFSGDLYESNSYGLALAGPLDFVHNTIVQLAYTKTTNYPTVEITGSFGMVTRFKHNIVVTHNTGLLLRLSGSVSPFAVEVGNNLYFATQSALLFAAPGAAYKTLSAFQSGTGQGKNSLYGDPLLQNPVGGASGLRLKAGSPAVGKASGTPAFVTDDFAGTKRPKPATIGGYEGQRKSTFIPYGKGCAGTGGHVPAIGYSGTLQMGATNFAVTLAKAKGGGAVQAWFAVGVRKVSIPFGGSCRLLASPDLLLVTGVSGTAPGNGTARIPFALPSVPKLKGASAHFQWGVIDSAAAGGVAFSNAASLTL